jgi:hypothetical protein
MIDANCLDFSNMHGIFQQNIFGKLERNLVLGILAPVIATEINTAVTGPNFVFFLT